MIDRKLDQRGFTLLEVLLALAVLAMCMSVLMGTMATSGQQAIYANKLTRVSQFSRIKMTDLEYKLMKEGFSDDVEKYDGDFSDQGYENITWNATVYPVEIPPNVKEQLIAQVNAQLFGGQDTKGALKGNAAFSAMLPMLVAQVPEMINQIGKKVRRVKLVIHYAFAGHPQTMTVTQYVVDQDTANFNLFGTGDSSSDSSGDK